MRTKFAVGVCVAAISALTASPAFAGEITGNGTLKEVHGNSPCAFSGQEDLQWYTDDSDTTPVADPIKGVPAHSQNWGHVKQDTGLTGGANDVPEAEWGCNGHDFGLKH
jgi:hypothetical protein